MQAGQTLVFMVWMGSAIEVWEEEEKKTHFAFAIQKSKVNIMDGFYSQPCNGYTDTEQGWQLKMSCVQVDWTLVFIVWMKSHIKVCG